MSRDDLREEARLALHVNDTPRAAEAADRLLDAKSGPPSPADWLIATDVATRTQNPEDAREFSDKVLADARSTRREQLQATVAQANLARLGATNLDSAKVDERLRAIAIGADDVALDALVVLAQEALAATGGTGSVPSQTSIPASGVQETRANPPGDNVLREKLRTRRRSSLQFHLSTTSPAPSKNILVPKPPTNFSPPISTSPPATSATPSSSAQSSVGKMPITNRSSRSRPGFIATANSSAWSMPFPSNAPCKRASSFSSTSMLSPLWAAGTTSARSSRRNVSRSIPSSNTCIWRAASPSKASRTGPKIIGSARSSPPRATRTSCSSSVITPSALPIAAKAFGAAAAASPKSRMAQQGRLRAAYEMRDTRAVYAILLELQKIWPNDRAIKNDEAYVRLLQFPMNEPANPELNKIEALAEQLVKDEPASLPHRTLLALARLKQARGDAALAVYSGIKVPANAVSPSAIAVHAAVLSATGHREEARAEIGRVPMDKLMPEEQVGIANLR